MTTSGKRRQPSDLGDGRPAPPEPASFAASPLSAPMHGAFYLDDDLLEGQSLDLGALHEATVRAREAFRGVQQRDGAHTLAGLGGSEPDLKTPGPGAFRGAR